MGLLGVIVTHKRPFARFPRKWADSVLVSLMRSGESRPREGAGRVDTGHSLGRALQRFPSPPEIPSCFPLPQKCKSRTPRVTFSLVTLGSPAVLVPESWLPGSATFRPYLTIGLALSFVGGKITRR